MYKDFDAKRIKMKKGAEGVFLEIKKKLGAERSKILVKNTFHEDPDSPKKL